MTYRGQSDRRFNDWHYSLPADWHYMDLDGIEVCPRCRAALLLYETTRDPAKATSIIQALATRADLPAVLLLLPNEPAVFDDATTIQWRWIHPVFQAAWTVAPLLEWQAVVGQLRDRHRNVAHRRTAAA